MSQPLPTSLTLRCSKVMHGSPLPSARSPHSSAWHSSFGTWKPHPPFPQPSVPPPPAAWALALNCQLCLEMLLSLASRPLLLLAHLVCMPWRHSLILQARRSPPHSAGTALVGHPHGSPLLPLAPLPSLCHKLTMGRGRSDPGPPHFLSPGAHTISGTPGSISTHWFMALLLDERMSPVSLSAKVGRASNTPTQQAKVARLHFFP